MDASAATHSVADAAAATKHASAQSPCALVLAGSLRATRATPIASALGIPVSALPIDANHCGLGLLMERLLRDGLVSRVAIALSDTNERVFYERVAEDAGYADRLEVWVDRQSHRGPAGTVRDYCDGMAVCEADRASGVLVIEAGAYTEVDFAQVLEDIDERADATVLATNDLHPCGVIYLPRRTIDRIPRIGFYDLKQQLLKAISESGGRTVALRGDFATWRIADLRGYLAVVSRRQELGEVMISPRARIDPSSLLRGAVLIARDAVVEAGAFLTDSVVLPSAVIGSGAVIARSVIPPGARVPAGARVVDQVYAALDSESGSAVRS